ncbi:high mobility group box domain-containing protein [Delphinella strobiligena]|nr:high mobility group box domain-containing protein [Delphinella strobiligena]
MLERLGLSQYLQVFLDEGFDTWDTLMDVTESDLDTLHVKLGHRRKLQRAIIEVRGRTRDNFILGARQQLGPKEEQYRSEEESGTSARDRTKSAVVNNGSSGGQKRKYRRHPKPDEYAPERPPSAYVIFSNQMRDRLKGQDLSFTEIAKIVGERWQVLSTNEKEPCERQAQGMKEKYYTDLAEYKKTPHYSGYQEYLIGFKAKHNQKQGQGSETSVFT